MKTPAKCLFSWLLAIAVALGPSLPSQVIFMDTLQQSQEYLDRFLMDRQVRQLRFSHLGRRDRPSHYPLTETSASL